MKIQVLVDNNSTPTLCGEWGLSIYIENNGTKLLLDTGKSDLFKTNAGKLGINLGEVDIAMLSHAHYDHAGGFCDFFDTNKKAKIVMSKNAGEDCYKLVNVRHRYIGIPRGTIEKISRRILYVDGKQELAKGIYALPHSTPTLYEMGQKNKMYRRVKRKYQIDNFDHELTLVIEKDEGLVIFNSCSHSGPDVIIKEVKENFPEKKIIAYIGGLHLYKRSKEEIEKIGGIFRGSNIGHIYTGHCTGDKACEILKKSLGNRISILYSGMEIEI